MQTRLKRCLLKLLIALIGCNATQIAFEGCHLMHDMPMLSMNRGNSTDMHVWTLGGKQMCYVTLPLQALLWL